MSIIGPLASVGGKLSSVFNAASAIFGVSDGLTLGEVTFASIELPSIIKWGGKQRIIENVLPGGKVILHSMGVAFPPLTWTGYFEGIGAIGRSRQLYSMLNDGKERRLTWNDRAYTVIIEEFGADDSQTNWIPYAITCRVLRDETLNGNGPPKSLLGQLVSDVSDALGITPADIQLVSQTVTAVQIALQAAGAVTGGTFENASATQATAQAQAAVASALAGVNGYMGGIVQSAGPTATLPAGTAEAGTANLLAALAAADELAALATIHGLMGRITANLGNAGT